MRDFMEAVQKAFYDATGWNRDNSYSSLNISADGLLRFSTPQGLHMTLSSLATPQFATSYELSTVGVVDGSLSYVYSSVPLQKYFTPQSETVSLPTRMQSYRQLSPLNTDAHVTPIQPQPPDHSSQPPNPRSSLIYGRLYLPQSMLEALVVKKLSPALQVQFSAVSSKLLRNNGTVLALGQYDVGRYAIEGLASSDGGLLGLRGIYNFHAHDEKERRQGLVAKPKPKAKPRILFDGDKEKERDRIYGRFSAGAEIYYGTLNKSGGVSLGARFATLPEHIGTPLTATLTLNPLMGSISASYAVMAGKTCSLGTRLDFNVYSYESDWLVGIELWRRRFPGEEVPEIMQDEKGSIITPKFKVLSQMKSEGETSIMLSTEQNRLQKKPTQTKAVETVTAVSKKSLISERETGFERSFESKMNWKLDNTVPNDQKPMISNVTSAPKPLSELPASTLINSPTLAKVAVVEQSKTQPMANASESPAVTQSWKESDIDDSAFGAVIKARLNQNMKIGLVWEGRVKALLFSLGFAIDLRKRDQPFRTVGLEVQYSS